MSLTSGARRRALTLTAAGLLAAPTSLLLSGTAYAANGSTPHVTSTSPQPASNADYSGHGANRHGAYDSTRDGSPSANGNGGGKATGKPCAGCVGKADNKNPRGQAPDGSDHNHGYECDRNHGIGRGNPAHTGCAAEPTQVAGSGSGSDSGSGSGSGSGGVVGGGSSGAAGDGAAGDVSGSGTALGSSGQAGAAAGGPQVQGLRSSRGSGAEVLGTRTTRVLASALPFTGSHVDELLVSGVLLLASGSAIVLLGRRREA